MMTNIIAVAAAAVVASQATGALGLCIQNSECTCVNEQCHDNDGINYGSACTSSTNCWCDTNTGEGNLCRYSRNPPADPSTTPTTAPSPRPSKSPTKHPLSPAPSRKPTVMPTKLPSSSPINPTNTPSISPSKRPTSRPATGSPTNEPSPNPTKSPTGEPSKAPTDRPSTARPTSKPTLSPSSKPTSQRPTKSPTDAPAVPATTPEPTVKPTLSTMPSCSDPEEGCGYGIWNVWTCQCDCAPGFCLSANQKCYDGCTTHLDFNPFGGCIPDVDCPWYPEPHGKTHCVSTVNIAGQYNIHRTVEQCCDKHFSYLSLDSCVSDSKQSVESAKVLTSDRNERPKYFYPDLYGRDNCVYHNGYYDWMMGSFSDSYLFTNGQDCCQMWYPARTAADCPDLSPPTERDVDEQPYPVKGYHYPHLSESNCRFGRNYPQWMALEQYVQHYLYSTPEECCAVHYPEAGANCPLGPDDGIQEGRYWLTDIAFYPDWKNHEGCNVGDDWPEWMGDPVNIDTHLFETASACCEAWFGDDVSACEASVKTTHKGNPVEGKPETKEEWWPTPYPYDCSNDPDIPSWMLQAGYKQYYVFDTRAECCKVNYCTSLSFLRHPQ